MNVKLTVSYMTIQGRRSIYPKMYEQGVVSKEEISALLEVAKWAPSHKNTQPWRFAVFTENSLKALVDLQVELLLKQKGENEETLAKAEKMREKASKTAAIIAIIMKRDVQKRVPIFEEEWAVACAVQNIHIHASALNLGCYWSTGASTNADEIRNMLNLTGEDRHMGWFFVGRFTGEKSLPTNRTDVEHFTEWR
jgi:nitroreductase